MLPAVPVAISYCHVNYQTSGGLFITWTQPQAVHITFTNESPTAAREVRFLVRLAGQEKTFRDVGTFAPHAQVQHVFTGFGRVRYGPSLPQPTCSVSSVIFADGTQWVKADRPPSQ